MNAATRLVQIVLASGAAITTRWEPVDERLPNDLERVVFITLPSGEAVDIRGDLARRWLDSLYYAHTKVVASKATIDRAIDQLRALALFGDKAAA